MSLAKLPWVLTPDRGALRGNSKTAVLHRAVLPSPLSRPRLPSRPRTGFPLCTSRPPLGEVLFFSASHVGG